MRYPIDMLNTYGSGEHRPGVADRVKGDDPLARDGDFKEGHVELRQPAIVRHEVRANPAGIAELVVGDISPPMTHSSDSTL